jgi:hypothetical protein
VLLDLGHLFVLGELILRDLALEGVVEVLAGGFSLPIVIRFDHFELVVEFFGDYLDL